MSGLEIGGAPVLFLSDAAAAGRDFSFVRAAIAPGRGMMLLQAWGRLAGHGEVELIAAPPLDEAAAILAAGGPDDFAGNLAFSFGGAILLPYANRIRGGTLTGSREIRTTIDGREVRLPRNWGGRAPGAEQYAMHGLILNRPPERTNQAAANRVEAEFDLADFEGRWPSRATAKVAWALEDGRLRLQVRVRNEGGAPLPAGVGWHPYFKLLGGARGTARLQLQAPQRLAVNDYDEVLPTGQTLPVAGSRYDFSAPDGAALGDLYLDDCFVGLTPGPVTVAIADAVAGYRLRLRAMAPPVRAVQVYAPTDRALVVVEPQTNWADPFGGAWLADAPPIPMLSPGQILDYEVVTDLSA